MAVGQSGGGSVGGPSVGFELSQDSVTSPRPADGIPTLEELLGLPPVDVAAPEGALKLEDLCERCSAAQLTSSFAKSSVKFLMDPEAYRAAWGGYCRCPAELLGESTGLDPECAAFCVESLHRCIGELAGQGAPLDVHFGVGSPRVCDRVARFAFTQSSVEQPAARSRAERDSVYGEGRTVHGGGSVATATTKGLGGASVYTGVTAPSTTSPRRPPGQPSRGSPRPGKHAPSALGGNEQLGRYLPLEKTEVPPPPPPGAAPPADDADAKAYDRFVRTFESRREASNFSGIEDRLAAEAFAAALKNGVEAPDLKCAPLLDAHAGLRAATYAVDADELGSASARVGHFYAVAERERERLDLLANEASEGAQARAPRAPRGRAAEREALRQAELEQQAARKPFPEREPEDDAPPYPEADAARYGHYLARGVPDHLVEPIDDGTIARIFERVRPRVPASVVFPWPGDVDELADGGARVAAGDGRASADRACIERVLAAARDRFAASIRKATLDSVLLSPHERDRLGLRLGPPPELVLHELELDYGHATPRAGRGRKAPAPGDDATPARWRASCRQVKEALSHRLLITSPPFIECHRVWQTYEHLLLVKLPSTDDVVEHGPKGVPWRPQPVADFERDQLDCLEATAATLKTTWHPTLANAFFEGIESGKLRVGGRGNVDARAYFNVAALIMGSQLNQIVRRSVATLLAYLEAFATDRGDGVCALPPAFLLAPSLVDGAGEPGVCLVAEAEHLAAAVLRVFERTVGAFGDLERIEVWRRRTMEANRRTKASDGALSALSARRRAAAQVHGLLEPRRLRGRERRRRGRRRRVGRELRGAVVARVRVPVLRDDDRASRGEEPAGPRLIAVMTGDEAWVTTARDRIIAIVDANLAKAKANLLLYRPFEFLLRPTFVPELDNPYEEEDAGLPEFSQVAETALKTKRSRPSNADEKLERSGRGVEDELADLERRVREHRDAAADVAETAKHFDRVPFVELDVEKLHNALVDQALAAAKRLLEGVATSVQRDVRSLTKRVRVTVLWLQQRPSTVDELVVAQHNLDHARDYDLRDFRANFRDVKRKVDFLCAQNGLTLAVLEAARTSHAATREVADQVDAGATELAKERDALEADLGKRGEQIKLQLATVAASVLSFSDKGNPKLIREYIDQLTEVRTALTTEAEGIEAYNAEEAKLGLAARTSFPELETISRELMPYERLWQTALRFHLSYSSWVKGPIRALDGEQTARDHAEMVETIGELTERLGALGAQEPAKFAQSIYTQLERFAPNVPIVRALSSKFLREQHWREISQVVGFQLSAENITNLTNLLELSENRPDKASRLEEIAKRAEKEGANLNDDDNSSSGAT
ncbi:dynein light chain binding protein [Aureococcus anophagefferens]|nr:dynein light chain binding protein [Aureococcus anophagefferens]